MKIKIFLIILSGLFSTFLYAETITVISTSPTIDGVQGTPTENTLTRAKGKVITITAKPKEGFQGVIKIDGVVVSTGEVNNTLRYRYTIVKDVKVEVNYISQAPILISHQFVELRGREGHQGLFPLFSSPNAGDAKLQITTSKGVKNLLVTLVSDFGNTDFVAVKGDTSAGDKDEWSADLLLPSTAFKLRFTMTPNLGEAVTIESDVIVPRTFSMLLSLVDGHTFSSGKNNVALSITNNSNVNDSYEIIVNANESEGYLSNPLVSKTIDIKANATESILIPILIPKNIKSHTLKISAKVNEISGSIFEEGALEVLVLDEPLTLSALDSKVVINPASCLPLDRTQQTVNIMIAGSSHLDVNDIDVDTLTVNGEAINSLSLQLIDIGTRADKPCDEQQADGLNDLLITVNLQNILVKNSDIDVSKIHLSIDYLTKSEMRYIHSGFLIFPVN